MISGMKDFVHYLRDRMVRGIRLSDDDHDTIDGVLKRMRNAIRKGRGIRLSRDELRVLGLYGLKQQLPDEDDPNHDGS